jgi:hypothetical protein
MRTTNLKTIYLTIPELQEAVAEYIRGKQEVMGPEDLYTHLKNNAVCMDWTSGGEEFVVSMDGEMDPITCSPDSRPLTRL